MAGRLSIIIVINLLVIFTSQLACSQPCTESVCNYHFVIRRTKTMTHRRNVNGKWDTNSVFLRDDGRLELFSTLGNPAQPGKENVNGTLVPMDAVITTDGVQRNVITVNDMFPGPTIEVMEGAQVVVTVTNKLLTEATSIHWHGMHMRGMPYMDGVPFITQCPIMPSETFVYRFHAEPAGTHWYHSHLSTQKEDGLFGALIVHKAKYPIMPSFPVILHDWSHVESTAYWISNIFRLEHMYNGDGEYILGTYERSFSHDAIKLSSREFNSALINGRGRFGNNKAPLSTFSVCPDEDLYFRVINSGADYPFRFSVDQHELTVTGSDGHDIVPLSVQSIILYPGERYDVRVNANQATDLYWIRAETIRAGHCTKCYPYDEVEVIPDDITQEVRAVLVYKGVETDRDPTTAKRNCTTEHPCYVFNCPYAGFADHTNTRCISFSDSHALPSEEAGQSKSINNDEEHASILEDKDIVEMFLNFNFRIGSSVNGRRFIKPTAPLHQNTKDSTVPCDEEQCRQSGCRCTHMIDIPYNKTIQLVMYNTFVPISQTHHSVHLHGHDFQVVAMGYPSYNRSTGRHLLPNPDLVCKNDFCTDAAWRDGPPALNLIDPPKKDTVIVPASGYTVVRFRSDNPGHWFMHCHNDQHMKEGMALVFQEALDRHPSPPKGFPTCGGFSWSSEEYQIALQSMETHEVTKVKTHLMDPQLKIVLEIVVGGVMVMVIIIVIVVVARCYNRKRKTILYTQKTETSLCTKKTKKGASPIEVHVVEEAVPLK